MRRITIFMRLILYQIRRFVTLSAYISTFENYILLEIAAGNLKRSKSFDHEQYDAFKERQFAEFKKTEEYRKLIKDMKKESDGWDQPGMDSFIRSYVTNYTAKILVD